MENKCENCKFLIELYRHPQNKVFSGSVTEKANLYACIVALDKEAEYEGFIFENNQGICELFKKRF